MNCFIFPFYTPGYVTSAAGVIILRSKTISTKFHVYFHLIRKWEAREINIKKEVENSFTMTGNYILIIYNIT